MTIIDLNCQQFYLPKHPTTSSPNIPTTLPPDIHGPTTADTIEKRLLAALEQAGRDNDSALKRDDTQKASQRINAADKGHFEEVTRRNVENSNNTLSRRELLSSPAVLQQQTIEDHIRPANTKALQTGESQAMSIASEHNAPVNVEADADGLAYNCTDTAFAFCPETIHGSSTPATILDSDGGYEEETYMRNHETHLVIVPEELTFQSHDSIPNKQLRNVLNPERQDCVGSDVLIHEGERGQSLEISEPGKSKAENKEERSAKRLKVSTTRSRSIPRRSLRPRRRIISSPVEDETENFGNLSSDTDTESPSLIDFRTCRRQKLSICSSAPEAKSEAGAEYREWPIHGRLKRARIGRQSSYMIDFNLGSVHHTHLSADQLQSKHSSLHATASQVEQARVRSYKSYELQCILDKRVSATSHVDYLVRWKDYGPEFDEWMPASAMNRAKELIDDYERQGAFDQSKRHVSKAPRGALRTYSTQKRGR